jgi:hypothetical protein
MFAIDKNPFYAEREPEEFGNAETETNVQDGGYNLTWCIVHYRALK